LKFINRANTRILRNLTSFAARRYTRNTEVGQEKNVDKEQSMSENHDAVIEGSLHSLDGVGLVRMKCRFPSNIDDLWSALTDPQRLARWYGNVDSTLAQGGEFDAAVFASGWEGHGHIDVCEPRHTLRVTMWEQEEKKHVVIAELSTEDNRTTLVLDVRGIALDVLFAYGAGWQMHTEDLGAHLAGRDYIDRPSRWDELEPEYAAMAVVAIVEM
jgi:uncharacterized protein YndB with AHSA1/START domain